MEQIIIAFGILVAIIVVLAIFFSFFPLGLWISAMASGVGLQASQRPCLVMPTGNTSYRSAQGACARARSQVEAETQLTSCSLDTPPKNSATRSFLVSFIIERLLNSYIQTHYKSSAYYNTILCRGLP